MFLKKNRRELYWGVVFLATILTGVSFSNVLKESDFATAQLGGKSSNKSACKLLVRPIKTPRPCISGTDQRYPVV